MKIKNNLKNPIIKLLNIFTTQEMDKASDYTLKLEDSVLPIFDLLKKSKLEQVGSGVLINIKNEYFIFSASHVFDNIGNYALSIGIGKGRKLLSLKGERFSTVKGKSGTHQDDQLDASVFHISEHFLLPEDIKLKALELKNLDLLNEENLDIHICSGFRVNKSYLIGNNAYGKKEIFPSKKLNTNLYNMFNLDKNLHIALSYDKFSLINGKIQKTPKLVGFSGGAIFRVKKILFPGRIRIEQSYTPLLAAITIQYEKETPQKNGIIIGTKIEVYLSLIDKYLPGFLDKL